MKRTYVLNPVLQGIYNNAAYQPQMTNHFEVNILFTRDLEGGTNQTQIDDMRKYITLATTDFSLPTITTTPIDIPYGNMSVHIAGKTEYGGAGSLTCVDYIGADTQRILYNWQMMVTNPETGQQGWAYNYKTDATVIQYAPDGSCISSWILRGVWPSEINYGGSLSKNDASIQNVEVTLSYDLAYKRFNDNSDNGRSKYKEASEAAAYNMTWKEFANYEQSNTGGPLKESDGQKIDTIPE